MRPILTAAQVRAAEDAFFAANPGVDLMARAAEHVRASAEEMLRHTDGGVLVVVGPGNNGGDGLFAAAALAAERPVKVWLTAGNAHEVGLAAAKRAGCVLLAGEPSLVGVSLVIDAVAGIGGRAGLAPEVARLAQECVDGGVPVLAVDLPSGLQADLPGAAQSFWAARTLTFIESKLCHVASPAKQRCGEVVVADIGVSVAEADLWQAEEEDVWEAWPVPDPCADKYSRGVVGIDTGSRSYPGAAVLNVLGATHAGAGMVRYLGPARELVLAAAPSVVSAAGRVQSMVVGSGWGAPDAARLAVALEQGVPLVIDAEALVGLPQLAEGCLLTPHAGELAAMLGLSRAEVEADPVGLARRAADRFGATVLLKGRVQVVASPDGRAVLPVPGPAWTAQAGAGDVLAGICGALLAAGLDASTAGVLGASVQALAARRNPGPFPPDALARLLPALIGEASPNAE